MLRINKKRTENHTSRRLVKLQRVFAWEKLFHIISNDMIVYIQLHTVKTIHGKEMRVLLQFEGTYKFLYGLLLQNLEIGP